MIYDVMSGPMVPPMARCGGQRSSWRRRLRPLPVREGCSVVALVASHITSRRRLQYLEHCLSSVTAQTARLDGLYISWHADDTLVADVLTLFRRVKLSLRFRPLRQLSRCSQYEHLSSALEGCLREAPHRDVPLWVSFADDDDLWHPQRVELIRAACVGASPRTGAFTFGVYAYPIEQLPHEVRGSEEAQRALDSRQAAVWVGASEVFQFVVRHPILETFLKTEPASVLGHRFADVRFAQYVRRQQQCGVRRVGPEPYLLRHDWSITWYSHSITWHRWWLS